MCTEPSQTSPETRRELIKSFGYMVSKLKLKVKRYFSYFPAAAAAAFDPIARYKIQNMGSWEDLKRFSRSPNLWVFAWPSCRQSIKMIVHQTGKILISRFWICFDLPAPAAAAASNTSSKFKLRLGSNTVYSQHPASSSEYYNNLDKTENKEQRRKCFRNKVSSVTCFKQPISVLVTIRFFIYFCLL